MKEKLAVAILSSWAVACFDPQALSERSSAGTEILTDESAADGVTSGEIAADAGVVQTITATNDAIYGASVSFAPGSLNVGMNVSLEQGSDLAGDDLAISLGYDTAGVSSASNALVVNGSEEVDAVVPFTLELPISGAGLALADGEKKLAVFYRIRKHEEGGRIFEGVLPPGKLRVAKGKVSFETRFFGSYQAAYVNVEIKEAKEVATDVPILTKSTERKLKQLAWEGVKVEASEDALKIAGLISEPKQIKSCVLVIDSNKKAPWQISCKSIRSLEFGFEFAKLPNNCRSLDRDEGVRHYARLSCRDLKGRSTVSPWSEPFAMPAQEALRVEISTTAFSPTNANSIPVTITFSSAVKEFSRRNITVENGTMSNLEDKNPVFSMDVTPEREGDVTITVKKGVRADNGSQLNEAVSLVIKYDDNPPSLTDLNLTPASPSTNLTPEVAYTLNEPARVTLYSDANCTHAISVPIENNAGDHSISTQELEAGNTTVIYIRAEDSATNLSDCTEVGNYQTQLPAPALYIKAYSGALGINWSSVQGAQSYNLYSTTAGGDTTSLEEDVTAWYYHRGLVNGQIYRYKVAAVKNGVEGELSDEVSATPSNAEPKLLEYENLGPNQVTLSWESSSAGSDTSYVVNYSSSGGDDENKTTSDTPLTINGLRADEDYTFKVAVQDDVAFAAIKLTTPAIWERVETGSETMRDNETGLWWSKSISQSSSQSQATSGCDTQDQNSENDWRLPTIAELEKAHGNNIPADLLDSKTSFWSSSEDNPPLIGIFNSTGFTTVEADASGSYSVICVRQPSWTTAYDVNDAELYYTDNDTGRRWTPVQHSAMNWDSGEAHCEGLELGGISDWKLPGLRPLKTARTNGLAEKLGLDASTIFWTSNESSWWWPGWAKTLDLYTRNFAQLHNKTDQNAVICVSPKPSLGNY